VEATEGACRGLTFFTSSKILFRELVKYLEGGCLVGLLLADLDNSSNLKELKRYFMALLPLRVP